MARTTLSAGEARRTALAAQGFGRARDGAASGRTLAAAIGRMGVLQIDSVNVFARSHYMPLYSRAGSYDPSLLDRLVFRRGTSARPAPYVEYLAHEAAFMPVDHWPVWGFKRDLMRRRYGGADSWVAQPHGAEVVANVRAELRDRGPLRPSEIESVVRRGSRGPWWDWDHAKRALEMMWRFGDVAIAGRDGFERVYALTEHVVPTSLLGTDLPEPDAVRELVRRAASSYGVATVSDLKDYYRLPSQKGVRAAVDELVDAGELLPVEVEGWRDARGRATPAWMHRDARVPRRVEHTALLTPFDPAVWFRERAERLFDFHYRIEIYVPQPKRQFGYYSLPVLADDRVVGRVDLKSDRRSSMLRVQSAWWEDHAASGHAADRIADELLHAAAWQGLGGVSVSHWGDATDHLAAALDAERHAHPNAEVRA
ncbi:winged helix-turn-helix domain-containing protein [Microbacterium halophytorum]|uniref:winged helix-turn-helix domain-containing protein n=1 Tax=Microbacterium halophytorum TaxID=2067568 RepID=UPI001E49D435|nr:crosslink repair DNA glycosylase YcaQ family protein [Microbacterium halophytorum]